MLVDLAMQVTSYLHCCDVKKQTMAAAVLVVG
jgi:hypothetical protein